MKTSGFDRAGRSRRKSKQVAGDSTRSQVSRVRVMRTLSAMRRGATLTRAARENGVSPRTVRRYASAALVQDRPGGRVRATESDRLVRYLVIPGPNGPMEVAARGSKTASEFAQYKAAVNRLLRGDRDAMADWHGKKIAGIELITASSALKNLADKGLLPYSLYRSFSGGGV